MSFELKARIGLDNSPLIAGLEQSKTAVRSFGRSIGSHLGSELAGLKGQFAAAFGVAAITAGVSHLVQMGGKIADMSQKFGISTDEVQALGYAAEQTGAQFEDIGSALKKIAIAKTQALGGDKGKQEDFARMGVTMEALKKALPVELLAQFSKEISNGAMTSQKLEASLSLMGKNADAIFPAMKAGLGDLIAEFKGLNATISQGTVAALDKIGDDFDAAMAKIKKVGADAFIGIYDVVGGSLANVGLLGEAAGTMFMAKFGDAAKAKGRAEWASDLIASMLGDSDAKASEALTGKLQGQLKRNLDRNAERESKADTEKPKKATKEPNVLELMKKALGDSVAQQFDSLARVGGFMQNNSQFQKNTMYEVLTVLQKIEALIRSGQSSDSIGALL